MTAPVKDDRPAGVVPDPDETPGIAAAAAGPTVADQARWRDLPWRDRVNPKRIVGDAPVFPLAVLFGLNAVDELDRLAFQVLTPNIRDHFNLSLTGVSALITVVGIVALLIELPVGYLADRRRRVPIVLGGAFVWALFSALTGIAGFVGGLMLLAVARAGSSAARLTNATQLSLLSDTYPVESRVRVIYAWRAANSVGQIVGPAVAGVLAHYMGWQLPFIVLAIPTVVLIGFGLRLTEPKRGKYERLAAGADDATAEVEEDPPGFGETFRTLYAARSSRLIYFSLPFLAASQIGLSSFFSLYYEEEFGMKEAQRGLIFSSTEPVQLIGLLFGAVLVQRIVSRDPGRAMRLLGLSAVGQGMCLALFALSPVLALSIAAHWGRSFIDGMLLSGVIAVISLAVPARMRALGFATGNLWILLGLPVTLVVGVIGDAIGIRAGILVFTPVFLIGAFLLSAAGLYINEQIDRVNSSSRLQAEARRRRLEGDPQMLIIRGLNAGYEQTQILFDVDFEVSDGEIVALLGTNGAGKSTLLKAISGIVQPTSGAIVFDGRDITNLDAIQSAHLGIAQVPGGRGIFPSLTVAENLRAAGWMYRKDKEYLDGAIARVIEYFPVLEKRWDTPAGALSGGEQQMLSLSQAFIARPKLLMIDELSLGLAPTIVERLLEIVRAIHANGTTIVLVEQSVNVALRLAKRAVFMEKGEIRFSGPTEELLDRPDILRAVFLKGAGAVTDANGADHSTNGNGNGNGRANGSRRMAARAERRRRAALLERPVVLEAVDITKRYGGVTAVRDVSFELHDGQILGLIGPNGAGKTTIFDMLSGFSSVNSGRVLLLGQDATQWPAWKRAKAGLGRSFQDARLWPSLTVKEAISAAMSQQVEMTNPLAAAFNLPSVQDSERRLGRKVEELIDLLGLGAFRDKFVSELSTGSRRMVEIATLIANEPRIIILDEPSSGIAQKETEALGPMLKEVQRYTDCSILVIEHDMPLLAGLADHVVALELGQVIAFGSPDEVLSHPRVVESYLGTATYEEIGNHRLN